MADLPPGFVLEQSAQAAPLPPGFQLEGQKSSPTDDMSTWERIRAGIGQGMTDAALSAEQLAAHAPWILGGLGNPSAMVQSALDPGWKDRVDAQAAEKAKYDKALLDTGAGKAGSIVGAAAATAPTMMLGGPATSIAGKALTGALQGGLGSALATPVADVKQEPSITDLVTGGGGQDFATEKLKQLGIGALAGGAGSAILGGAGKVLENLLPSNATANVLNAVGKKANATPFAAEGERLAQDTGVMLTPAQISGSKAGNMAENAARQSILSRDIAFAGDKARIQQLADHFERTMAGITSRDASPAIAGEQVRAATRSIVDKLSDMRSKAAAADYGEVRKITQNSVSLEPDNLRAELADLVTQHGEMGTGSSDSIAAFARKQLQGGSTSGDLDKLLLLRQHLSKVAGGQAKISGDNQDRMIAAKLLGAIDGDLDKAAATLPGDVGAALRTANERYRGFSQQIDSVKASPLGKILGEDFAGALQSGQFNSLAPEAVMERIGKLKPTELGVVRGLLEKEQPEAWNTLKRSFLEDALEKSKAMPASEGANTAVLRPNVLVKTLGDAKRLQAVFDPGELSQIQAGLDVARRLSDKTGYAFSGTPGQQEVLGLMNQAKNAGVTGALSLAGTALGSRSLARLMTNSNGRAALMQIQRLPAGSAKARQLAAYLTAIAAGDEGSSGE